MQVLKIGLINEYFPPHAPGGAEWSTYYLGQRLAEAEHSVVVITPNYGAPAQEIADGMKIYRYWFPQKLENDYLAHSSLLSNPIYYLYSAIQIYRIARREGLQVLHAQNIYSLPGTCMAARWLKIPSVVTLRDVRYACVLCLCLHQMDTLPQYCSLKERWQCMKEFDRLYNPGKSFLYRTKWYLNTTLQKLDLGIRSFYLKQVDQVITISDGLKKVYTRAGKFPASRAKTIYNFPPSLSEVSTNVQELRCKYGLEGKKVILAVGKMSFGKGSAILVEALPEIIAHVQETVLVFIGRENPLITIPSQLQPFVCILGVRPQAEVLQFYTLADVVAFPVIGPEGQGRVLLEAMSMGRPVVASRVGGIPETVADGESGILINRNNRQELVEALVKILSDPELARKMGENGRRILSEKFAVNQILNQHLEIYTRKSQG